MPANFVLLQRIELNASAASVTFANIPQTGYTDLKVVVSARTDYNAAVASLGVYLNTAASDTSYRWLRGNGAVAASGNDTSRLDFYVGEVPALTATASTFSNTEIYIPNYTGSQQKSMSADSVSEQNGTTAYAYFSAGLCTKTAAINSVTVRGFEGTGNLVSGSTFSLYGLAALGTTPVIAPKASGGNRIDYDGTYWIHTFNTSGTFTPQTALSCDYLVVAGGGGGGTANFAARGSGGSGGGGGGAGGFRTGTGLSVLAQSYSITVGAGGAGVTNTSGLKGSNSVFSTITSTGGGFGGGDSNNGSTVVGGAGGSSGGSCGWNTTSTSAGTAASPAGEGNAGGGIIVSGGQRAAAGGGGASAAGGGASMPFPTPNASGGAGGAGLSNSYSGTAVTYAGGGGGVSPFGGVAGGAGGGGAGVLGGNGTNGTVNLGGGGGGALNDSGTSTGGSGGSGIVIIRYLA